MIKKDSVPRPLKKSEFEIRYGTAQARKGWRDLVATQRAAMVEAWDFLTRHPHHQTAKNHPMKGDLATVVREGAAYERWQHELAGGARIWFYVEDRIVYLVDVHTHHPHQTK